LKLETVFAVGIGGFIGANLRLYLNGLASSYFHLSVPIGTLFVNLLGSFFIGFLFAYFHTNDVSPAIKTFLVTGLLGALTTFSTFAYENYLFIQGSNFKGLFLNMSLNMFGTLLAVYLGDKIGKIVFKFL
jgi:CrcB protein